MTKPHSAPSALESPISQPAATRSMPSSERSRGMAGGTLPTCKAAAMPPNTAIATCPQRVMRIPFLLKHMLLEALSPPHESRHKFSGARHDFFAGNLGLFRRQPGLDEVDEGAD